MFGLSSRTRKSVVGDFVNFDVMTDRELLKQFTAGSETAFAALVQRHAGLVLRVCQRVLGQANDAEEGRSAQIKLSVNAETIIILDGKPAQAAALKKGSAIVLRLADDRQLVRAIKATSPEPEDAREDDPDSKEDK